MSKADWRLIGVLSLLVGALVTAAAGLCGQDAAPSTRSFSLSRRARISLTTDWTRRDDTEVVLLTLSAFSVPPLNFSELVVLENRNAPAVLEMGLSDNPFIGGDARQLDVQIHASLVRDLFYLFFPPPPSCLLRARAAFEQARRKEDENEKGSRRPVAISQTCYFSPTPADLFRAQISAGVHFRDVGEGERIEGELRSFYLPSMEQITIGGMTFFVFQARAGQALDRDDIRKFGLPDDSVGARAYFFWALGAAEPFPFLRDPARKEVELTHVVYACLSADGDALGEFRERLKEVSLEP